MKRSETDVEVLLMKARQDGVPSPSSDLMARVLADAEMAQPGPVARSDVQQPGIWSRILEGVGGWPSLGGLVAATVVGFGIGISSWSMIETPAASLLGQSDTLSQYDADLSGLGWELSEG